MQPLEGRLGMSFVMIEEATADGNKGGRIGGWLPCLHRMCRLCCLCCLCRLCRLCCQPCLWLKAEAPAASTLAIDSGAGRRLRRRHRLCLHRWQRMGLLFQLVMSELSR